MLEVLLILAAALAEADIDAPDVVPAEALTGILSITPIFDHEGNLVFSVAFDLAVSYRDLHNVF